VSEHAHAPLKFAYWVPNVSGGLVTSTIEQRTDWGYDYNVKLAQLAENNGFEYALTQVRYMASYSAAFQHESTGFSLALLLATQRLKVIAAVHPGMWQPGVLAKLVATQDQLSGGRACVNVVSGWFKDEFTKLGEPWLEHDERYRRSAEFIQMLREIWTSDHAEFMGDFYRLHDFDLKPKPVEVADRPHPEIFQGGNSTAARRNGGRHSDWYFSNGKDYDGFSEQVADVNRHAEDAGRLGAVRFGLNGFCIARETEAEARETLREIVAKADRPAVEASTRPSSRPGRPPPTSAACGRTRASPTSSSTTTASAPS
jgi:FMNH2-dependent dimethyl sulfone monooxygenase